MRPIKLPVCHHCGVQAMLVQASGYAFADLSRAYYQHASRVEHLSKYLLCEGHRSITYRGRSPAHRGLAVYSLTEGDRPVKELGEHWTGSARLMSLLPGPLHLTKYLHLSQDKRVDTRRHSK